MTSFQIIPTDILKSFCAWCFVRINTGARTRVLTDSPGVCSLRSRGDGPSARHSAPVLAHPAESVNTTRLPRVDPHSASVPVPVTRMNLSASALLGLRFNSLIISRENFSCVAFTAAFLNHALNPDWLPPYAM